MLPARCRFRWRSWSGGCGSYHQDREVVAYCRGPYRAFAPEAVRTLREHGYAARYLADGLPEWADAGRDVEVAANSGATVNR